jgi:hypothetical protein
LLSPWFRCRAEQFAGRRHRQPLIADQRNYHKVEKSTKEGRVERMLYAGSNLDRARLLFKSEIKRRPRIRLTIRQRTRVLQQWPE